MKNKFRRSKKPNDALPSLQTEIDALDLASDNTNLRPARDAFRSASALLATIRVCLPPAHLGQLFADSDVRRTR